MKNSVKKGDLDFNLCFVNFFKVTPASEYVLKNFEKFDIDFKVKWKFFELLYLMQLRY